MTLNETGIAAVTVIQEHIHGLSLTKDYKDH